MGMDNPLCAGVIPTTHGGVELIDRHRCQGLRVTAHGPRYGRETGTARWLQGPARPAPGATDRGARYDRRERQDRRGAWPRTARAERRGTCRARSVVLVGAPLGAAPGGTRSVATALRDPARPLGSLVRGAFAVFQPSAPPARPHVDTP